MAAKKILVPLDLGNLELYNLRLQNLAVNPSQNLIGQVFYDTAIDSIKYRNSNKWIAVDPSKVEDGYIPISKISGAAPLISPTFTGVVTTPAGSTTQAGGLKLTAGSLKTTPIPDDAGSLEFNGTTLSFIDNTGARRTLGISGSGIQSVTLTQPEDGFTISQSGTPNDPVFTFVLSDSLLALQNISSNGIIKRTGTNTFTTIDENGTGNVVLTDSPTFTGVPLTTTAAVGTNTKQIATTEFVINQAGTVPPNNLGTANTGSSTKFAREDHTHAMPTLSQVGAPTASVSLNNQKITGLNDPTLETDAANKRYVDNAVAGIPWKEEVLVATTTNIANLATGAPNTVDGISLAVGSRILVKDQTSAAQNGIYSVTTLGTGSNGVWARAKDADTENEIRGMATFVVSGTDNKGKRYVSTNVGAITVGTTPITFGLFGATTDYTASNGVQLTGSDISLKLDTNSGLSVSPDGLKVNTAVIARKYSAPVGDGSATTITLTHNLNTRDVNVSVYETSTYTGVICDWTANSLNTVQLTFAIAPTSDQFRATIVG